MESMSDFLWVGSTLFVPQGRFTALDATESPAFSDHVPLLMYSFFFIIPVAPPDRVLSGLMQGLDFFAHTFLLLIACLPLDFWRWLVSNPFMVSYQVSLFRLRSASESFTYFSLEVVAACEGITPSLFDALPFGPATSGIGWHFIDASRPPGGDL